MIYDSYAWKKELLCQKRLLRFYSIMNYLGRGHVCFFHKIDMSILMSAIIIRKLIESDKLSNEADSYKINARTYTPRRHVDRLHNWVEDEDYSWGEYQKIYVSAKVICNSIIHSYTYCPRFSDRYKLDGFFVTSDYDRNTKIYDIDIQDWFEYIDFISSDSISSQTFHYNSKNDDYISTIKQRE